jgi:type II secretory pathway pseudopilin PulG
VRERAVASRAGVAREDGFGLVELVVAMGVLALVGVVLAYGMTESFQAAALARQRSVASGLLSAADAAIQAAPAGGLGALASSTTTSVDGVAYCTSLTSTTNGQTPPLYTFTITVTWPGCGGAFSLQGTAQAGGT